MDSILALDAADSRSAQTPPPQRMPDLHANAVILTGDRRVAMERLALRSPEAGEVVVDTEATSISTGTEKLFWSGEMPVFPGMGYPLVPGYETVGTVIWAEPGSALLGRRVFVPGAHSFQEARALFGGASSRLVARADRVYDTRGMAAEEALLLSLAATAYHALADGQAPDLIVGFGPLGRLLFRISMAMGNPKPQVWEVNPARCEAEGIRALDADTDKHSGYRSVYDASGNAAMIDRMIGALARGGTLTLAGFYPGRLDFGFAAAFQKEARLRIAAEWSPGDLGAVMTLIEEGKLSLSGLVSHVLPFAEAPRAYETAFTNSDCFKMILDWRAA